MPPPDPDADPERESAFLDDLKQRAAALDRRIPDLYTRMDTAALERRLLAVLNAGHVNGRVSRLEQLRRQLAGSGDAIGLQGETEGGFAAEPIDTAQAAQQWLADKVVVPTELSSIEISREWPAQMRMQSFFSARVASGNILGSFREMTRKIQRGELGYSEAVSQLSEFLAREGYGIPLPGTREDKDLRDIASTARMELILRQNVWMADALGARIISEQPAVLERFPNYRYIANTDRHARFDGLVLPKTHPFWQTHYPPWDFRCQCIAIDEEGQANATTTRFRSAAGGGQRGKVSFRNRVLEIEPPESGFLFSSDPAQAFAQFDPAAISDPEIRDIFEAELRMRNAEA